MRRRAGTNGVARAVVFALAVLGGVAGCVHFGTEPTKIEKAFFWRVEGGEGVSYLLGTIHTGVDAASELPPAVWRAFDASPCVALESDGRAVDAGEVQRRAQLPAGTHLSALVSRAAWAALRERLHATYPDDALERLAPWYVALLLSVDASDAQPGMDQVLEERAVAARKRLVFLEDWRDALTVVAETTTAKDLEELALAPDEAAVETRELTAAYRAGDEGELAAMFAELARESDAQEQLGRLLDERNRAWLPKLAATLTAGPCFVAVGAGHVVGAGNLRKLIAAKGLKSRRIAAP
jgi:uncharacterized protein YbaP (TraB family)